MYKIGLAHTKTSYKSHRKGQIVVEETFGVENLWSNKCIRFMGLFDKEWLKTKRQVPDAYFYYLYYTLLLSFSSGR